MALTVTEKWICERVNLKHDNLDDVKSLSLPGSYHEKIVHLGNSLKGFTRLKHLDLSRNDITVLDGLEHLKLLETLNLYYNNVTSLKELHKLRHNSNLKEIDIRLNPITKNEPDYRLFLIHMIPTLKMLDDRSVRDSERKAALSHFNTNQASQFDESPPKTKQTVDSERLQRPSRPDLVRKFASRHNVLDDDDVALIDLVAKTDLGREAVEKSGYYAETYDRNELRGIPSPHAEKYSSYLRPSSSSKAQHDYSREELQIEPASLIRDRLRREETQYDRQPFVSNGYFTANPVNEQYRSSDRRDKKTYIQQKTSEGTDASNERFSPAKGPVVRSHEFHTPPQDGGQFLRKADVNESRDSFVNSNDFKKQDVQRQVEIPHIETRIDEKETGEIKDLLWSILVLVDKYWNGSGSLQSNKKFQKIAEEVISRYLKEIRNTSKNSSSDEMASRDREIEELNTKLNHMETENERIKKRLQNEEEIQRTIEMTDKDLRRLQSRIEEVQAENKALKSKCIEAESDKKFVERLRLESDELKHNMEVLRKENQMLAEQSEQQSNTLSQLQEVTSMLHESHRSLVVTNDHFLKELHETRQRHQQEVQQLHWSYEQLKKTADWLPRSTK